MVNGMLARPDKKRIPVGLIPTGQCNDIARSFGIYKENIEAAIDNIANGEAVAMDTTRVLLDNDNDSESGLPAGEERLALCRHMLSNASLSMPAKIMNGAEGWRGYCGQSASFSLSAYMSTLSCGFVQDHYHLTIDDKPLTSG